MPGKDRTPFETGIVTKDELVIPMHKASTNRNSTSSEPELLTGPLTSAERRLYAMEFRNNLRDIVTAIIRDGLR